MRRFTPCILASSLLAFSTLSLHSETVGDFIRRLHTELADNDEADRLIKTGHFRDIVGADGEKYSRVTIRDFTMRSILVTADGKRTEFTIDTAPKEWSEAFRLLSQEEYALFEAAKRIEANGGGTGAKEIESRKDKTYNFTPNSTTYASVVTFSGDAGAGTGFLADIDGRTWVYTAAHVVSGNKRITIKNTKGIEFRNFDLMETAKGLDLMRLRLDENASPALQFATATDDIGVGDKVMALGNGDGAGVVAGERGNILGVSSDFYEVSSDIIPGNSGGPIIELTTGKAIGVVTHLTQADENVWTRGTRFEKVRRFGVRIDRDLVWQEQPISSFVGEGVAIVEYDKITRLLFVLGNLDATYSGLRVDQKASEGSAQTIGQILAENEDQNVVQNLYDMNRRLSGATSRKSEADVKRNILSVLTQARSLGQSTKNKLRLPVVSAYHEKEITQSLRWRNEAIEHLKKRVARFN